MHEGQHDAGGDGAVGDEQLQARNVAGRHAGARRVAAQGGGGKGSEDGCHGEFWFGCCLESVGGLDGVVGFGGVGLF